MKRIIKDECPQFWREYSQKNKRKSYSDADEGIKHKLKMHMLMIQKNICAYCCATISDASKAHNEHIKPKALYPKLSMDYDNLLASCTTQGENATCGMHKENKFDECLFVSPLSGECETHFRFDLNGKVTGTTDAGRYTVCILNLNAHRLVSARKALLDELEQCREYGKEYIQQYYVDEQEDGSLPRFVDMTEYFLKQGYYD